MIFLSGFLTQITEKSLSIQSSIHFNDLICRLQGAVGHTNLKGKLAPTKELLRETMPKTSENILQSDKRYRFFQLKTSLKFGSNIKNVG